MNLNRDQQLERDADRARDSHRPIDHVPDWQKRIWQVCAGGLLLMIFGLVSLVAFMMQQTIGLLQLKTPDNAFVFAGITLVNGSSLRLLAILIGGAIAFVGLAVSFFAHHNATSLDANVAREQLGSAKAALATNSPGLVAVIIGALVIIFALFSKGTLTYVPGYQDGHGTVSSTTLPSRADMFKNDKSSEPKRLEDVKGGEKADSVSEK